MTKLPLIALLCLPLLVACTGEPTDEAGEGEAVVAAAAPVQGNAPTDWGPCRVPGLELPTAARLFVIDAATPLPDAEPGREAIRRVDIAVPGEVALLLTAPEATAWHIRPGPEARVRAVVALGDAPQRITGQGLGPHRREAASSMGADCASYLLAGGAGPALSEATDAIFGKPHDALYKMRISSVIIGGPDPILDRPVQP